MIKIIKKPNSFLTPRFPVGIVFTLAGVYVAWIAGTKLLEIYSQFKPYLPFNAPPDFSDQLLRSLPAVFKYFTVIVSSLCGVLVGALWVVTGLSDIFQRREKTPFVPDLDNPWQAANFLVSSELQYWRQTSIIPRFIAKHWKRARNIQPVSHQLAADLIKSSLKVVMVGFIIAIVLYLLSIVPELLERHFHITMRLLVPSGRPLYFIIAIIAALNAVMILTLLPFPRHISSRHSQTLQITGKGTSQLFFALIEELCRLLTPRGLSHRAPIRLTSSLDGESRGSLIESHPEPATTVAKISAFLYLPLIYFPLTMGFSRLINFQRPMSQMPYSDFTALQLPDYIMETAFGVGLLLAGLYFAEWARRFFDIKRFRSFVIFCCSDEPTETREDAQTATMWVRAEGADERLAAWAKDPNNIERFNLRIYWAEGISEMAAPKSRRSLVRIMESRDLDSFMTRIISLPLSVHFQAETEPVAKDQDLAEPGR